MLALDKLKEKIEEWKSRIDELELANQVLTEQSDKIVLERDELLQKLTESQESISTMREEISAKDKELEEIMAKVEILIS